MAHTKYLCEHRAGGPGAFHLASCAVALALEAAPQRGPVVSSRNTAEMAKPNISYSDYRDALVQQGFTPCATCKP